MRFSDCSVAVEDPRAPERVAIIPSSRARTGAPFETTRSVTCSAASLIAAAIAPRTAKYPLSTPSSRETGVDHPIG